MMVELSTITEGKMQHNEIHIPETQARTDKELETGSMVVPLPPRPPKSPDSTPKHTVVMNPEFQSGHNLQQRPKCSGHQLET